jgi:hypothetical protein
MRTLALIAAIVLVVLRWGERDTWFWLGVTLVVLNVVGLLASRSSAKVGQASEPAAAGSQRLDEPQEDDRSYRLATLLSAPGVAAALAAGPPAWRQVSYLADFQVDPMTPEELAGYIWLEAQDGWSIGLADEVKPYLDLDLDETEDPMIDVLRSHPSVEDAYHEDREVYRIAARGPLSTEEFAELAARALVSHHNHAART